MSNNCKDEFMYELLKDRNKEEMTRRNDLDGKASNQMGYVSLITGLTISLGTISIQKTLTLPQFYTPYFLGILLLLASIVTALLSSRIMKWDVVPNISELLKEDANEFIGKIGLINKRIPELIVAIKNNSENNEKKAKWLRVSWYFLLAGLLVLVIFLIISVASIQPLSITE